jgi:hypothetical protein
MLRYINGDYNPRIWTFHDTSGDYGLKVLLEWEGYYLNTKKAI